MEKYTKEWWKKFWKAAGIRALRTTFQTLAGSLPVGISITPTMIQELNWNILYIVLAWIATGLFSGFASIITSFATDLPEIEMED